MLVKNFEDLEIWKEARRLTREIYQLTKDSRFSKDFGLSRQIQRAAISIMSNIAEGFEAKGIENLFNFSMWRKDHVEKYVLTFMWQSINPM